MSYDYDSSEKTVKRDNEYRPETFRGEVTRDGNLSRSRGKPVDSKLRQVKALEPQHRDKFGLVPGSV
jgi:hypothetical protein